MVLSQHEIKKLNIKQYVNKEGRKLTCQWFAETYILNICFRRLACESLSDWMSKTWLIYFINFFYLQSLWFHTETENIKCSQVTWNNSNSFVHVLCVMSSCSPCLNFNISSRFLHCKASCMDISVVSFGKVNVDPLRTACSISRDAENELCGSEQTGNKQAFHKLALDASPENRTSFFIPQWDRQSARLTPQNFSSSRFAGTSKLRFKSSFIPNTTVTNPVWFLWITHSECMKTRSGTERPALTQQLLTMEPLPTEAPAPSLEYSTTDPAPTEQLGSTTLYMTQLCEEPSEPSFTYTLKALDRRPSSFLSTKSSVRWKRYSDVVPMW